MGAALAGARGPRSQAVAVDSDRQFGSKRAQCSEAGGSLVPVLRWPCPFPGAAEASLGLRAGGAACPRWTPKLGMAGDRAQPRGQTVSQEV